MSADIDPTEAIPQVTAEMIAKAAVRPAAAPSAEPAPGPAPGSKAGSAAEPRRASSPAPLSATRPDSSPTRSGSGASDGRRTPSARDDVHRAGGGSSAQKAQPIGEQPAAPDAVLGDRKGASAFSPRSRTANDTRRRVT